MTNSTIEASPTANAPDKSSNTAGVPKSEKLRRLLSRPSGATVAQVQAQLAWQPHTVRAAILRLRAAGFSVKLDRSGKVTRYRLVAGQDQ
jgi:hypothetical protein